jgi:hypothetical protein
MKPERATAGLLQDAANQHAHFDANRFFDRHAWRRHRPAPIQVVFQMLKQLLDRSRENGTLNNWSSTPIAIASRTDYTPEVVHNLQL